jgi:hypothetical protein
MIFNARRIKETPTMMAIIRNVEDFDDIDRLPCPNCSGQMLRVDNGDFPREEYIHERFERTERFRCENCEAWADVTQIYRQDVRRVIVAQDYPTRFQECELDAFLGESAADYDIDAIIEEATDVNYSDGNRYWKNGIDLNEICARHDIWRGEGWYRIGFSDGGQDWTNNGPVWVGFKSDLFGMMEDARRSETETHLAWCEYMGSGDEPQDQG